MKISSILAGLLLVIGIQPLVANDTYFNDKTKINFSIPDGWSLKDNKNSRVIELVHAQDIEATLNVSVFYYPPFKTVNGVEEKSITINNFQRRRVSSLYDGWQNLFEREGTEKEIILANVSENYVAVYSQTRLDPRLNVTKYIVGEYYYLKRNMGVIISIQSPQSHWRELQESAKELVSSFWIGEGVRPEIKLEDPPVIGWGMIGQGSENRFYQDTDIDLSQGITTNWVITLPESSDPPLLPVLDDHNAYLFQGSTLSAYSITSGNLVWSQDLASTIHTPLLAYENILVFEIEDTLWGIMSLTGDIVFKVQLEGPTSIPIFYKQKILLVENEKLKARDAVTGLVSWENKSKWDTEFYPVASSNRVIGIQNRSEVTAVESKTGKKSWSKKMKGSFKYEPVLLNKQVLCITEDNNTTLLTALDIETGKQKWSTMNMGIAAVPLSAGKDQILYTQLNESTATGNHYMLYSFSPKDGSLIWSQTLTLPTDISLNRPILTNHLVILNGGPSETDHLVLIDNVTGGYIISPDTSVSTTEHDRIMSTIAYNKELYILKWIKNRYVFKNIK